MLDFETCKRLKEAGFPQISAYYWEGETGDTVNQKRRKAEIYERDAVGVPTGQGIFACPSIEDLLRELGDDFRYLTHTNDVQTNGLGQNWACGRPGFSRAGKSPESVLAELYLAIHSKSVEVTDYGHDGK